MTPRQLEKVKKLTDLLINDIISLEANEAVKFSYGPHAFLAATSILKISKSSLSTEFEFKCEQLPKNKEYPWEFIHWSNLESSIHHGDRKTIDKIPFKNTRVLNWRLLKIYVQSYYGNGFMEAKNAAYLKALLATHVTKHGFIQDKIMTFSHQYHIFSCFLLCRMRSQFNWSFLDTYIKNGFRLIVKEKIGKDHYLWRGRGQEQIFGYSALLYVSNFVNDDEGINTFDIVLNKFLSAYSSFGFLPLVVNNSNEKSLSEKVGWYGYNNYTDYLSITLLIMAILISECDNNNARI